MTISVTAIDAAQKSIGQFTCGVEVVVMMSTAPHVIKAAAVAASGNS